MMSVLLVIQESEALLCIRFIRYHELTHTAVVVILRPYHYSLAHAQYARGEPSLDWQGMHY